MITDADLARARQDAKFRQRLLTDSLELLLAELSKLQRATNTANSEAHYVARVIAAVEAGKDIDWESPHTICYSMVNGKPEEAIMVKAKYDKQKFGFTDVELDNKRSAGLGRATHEWGAGLYRDMF